MDLPLSMKQEPTTEEQHQTRKPCYLVLIVATWFGSGLSPVMPGTVGSMAALPFAVILMWPWGPEIGRWLLFGAASGLFLAGWYYSNVYMRATSQHDPKEVVVDEVVGQWLVLCAVPATPINWLLAFILFRIADIVKPFPVSYIDRHLKGGLGVMLDDIAASLYAIIVALLCLNYEIIIK